MNNMAVGPFVETKEYLLFHEFCDASRNYQYIGLCFGPPGVGKTLSARHYSNWDKVIAYSKHPENSAVTLEDVLHSETVFYTPLVADSPKHIAEAIRMLRLDLAMFRREEIDRRRNTAIKEAALRENIEWHQRLETHGLFQESPTEHSRFKPTVREVTKKYGTEEQALGDPTTLIIIDEADRLKMTGLEQVRAIFDCGGIGLVLIGMPGLEKRLARYPQLYSRVGFVHEFRPLSQADVRQLLREGWGPACVSLRDEDLIDEEAMVTLIRMADGRFRLLYRLLQQISRVLGINKLDKITREVVEAAREGLVIGTG